METRSIRKFTFDDFFELSQRQNEALLAARTAELEPSFCEADVARAREEGFEAGCAAALVEAERSEARRLASEVAKITEELERLTRGELRRQQDFRETALSAALAMVRKLMPTLSAQSGAGEIEALIHEVMADRHDEPRLVIRLSDEAFESFRDRIDEMAIQHGFAGKIMMAVDTKLGASDVRVEWAEGGVERLLERTMSDIEGAILRMVKLAPDMPAREQVQ